MNTSEQIRFDGGVNAVAATNAIAPNEVQTSTNVDFSLEWGGLVCRRGCTTFGTLGASEAISVISRNYSASTIDSSPWYAVGASTIARGTITAGSLTLSSIGSGVGPGLITYYQSNAYLAAGSRAIRDNGTSSYNWIMENPTSAPVISYGTSSSSITVFNGSFTASEGTNLGTAGSPWVLNTCTTGTGTRIVLTAGSSGVTNNCDLVGTYTHTGLLNTNTKALTVNPYGIDFLFIGFTNPSVVVRISRDVSIGDTTFTNYWHAETTMDEINSALPNPVALALNATFNRELTETQRSIIDFTRVNDGRGVGGRNAPNTPIGYIAPVSTGSMPWAVPRTDYQFVGYTGSPGWTDVKAVRVIVECIDTCGMVVGGWFTWGNEFSSLTDTVAGIRYAYTLAQVTNGLVVTEGGASPFSAPTKVQGAFSSVNIGAYNGLGTSGANYYGIYRQGGLLDDAYLVDYFPITGSGITPTVFNEWGYPDLDVINNPTLTRNIWGTWTNVNALSEAFYDRIFLGSGNTMWWSVPGTPTQIQEETETVVGNSGDTIQGFVVWDRLVVVNKNSVYEFDGNIFEGPSADWILKKSGAKRGSAAPKTIVKTPYGITLVGYDGISLYTPGYGVDQSLDWLYEKIGDAWRGTGTNDPASIKGNRVPAIDLTNIGNSCATYADGKLYLAVPTTGNSGGYPNTVFVIDFPHKLVQIYSYPFAGIVSLYWDVVQNRLIAGNTLGGLFRLETGINDVVDAGTSTNISWSAKTRAWTTKNDMVLENLSVEGVGTNIVIRSIIDNTSTTTLGTLTNTSRAWIPKSLAGTVGNNVVFQFNGTQSSAQQGVYGLGWDTIVQPPKVNYWRSEEDLSGGEQQKIWDVHFDEIDILGTGTVTAVTFIDNIATLTNTMTGLTGGRILVPTAFPAETYGYIAYTTYTGTPLFKIYKTYNITRPEPAPVVSYVTDRFIPGDGGNGNATMEAWWHDVLSDLNCNGGTTTATHYIDNLVVSTNTYTGNGRTGYTKPFIVQTYGNVAYTKYSSTTPFKHYVTYYKYDLEPTRTTSWEGSFSVLPSENFVKTWLPTINPQGGTVTALLYDESNAIIGSASLTGSIRKTYEIGLANITKGKTIKPIYTSSTPFKHYVTNYEFAPKPFGKQTWVVNYFRPQGASQLGMGRFHTIDLEGTSTSTVTSTWLVDETAILTNTWTISSGRNVIDQIPFPGGVRGYLFQQQLTSTNNFNVWRSNIDFENITVKGLVRNVIKGTPVEAVA